MDEGVVDTERGFEPIEFGTIIANRYTILRPDRGSLATFACRDSESDTLRSIWAFKPRHALDPNGDKFLLELTKVQSLEHPQLRKLLDFGREPSGILYAVYDPLEARNLTDVLERDHPLGDERVVWLVCQLLAALEVAHAVGLTHGDVRPENVLLRAAGSTSQNEEIMLCGLGLASSARYPLSSKASLKLTEWLVGTPRHASPEQLRGETYDARSDVYSAGVLLFQLLTRTQPFDAANDPDTAYLQCYTPPPPPSGYGRVSPALEAICLKALAKTPDVRYQSANEMRAALLASQVQRASRVSNRPSKRPARKSAPPRQSLPPSPSASLAPSVPPSRPAASTSTDIVVATRLSEPAGRLARLDSVTAAPIETPAPAAAPPPAARRLSATALLSASALAIAAALILPDLRDRETEDETTALSDLRDGFARHIPADAPNSRSEPAAQPVAAGESPAPIAAAPVSEAPPVAEAAPAPASQPSTAAQAPAAPVVAPRAAPVRRVARVRVHAVEKPVVAAEASAVAAAAEAAAIPMDVAPAAPAVADPAPSPAPPPPTAAEPAAALETAAPIALPSEREQPAEPMPPPVTAPPPPRPIVLTNAPRAAASEPTSTIAQEVDVSIGEANATHGAVSKAALRSAFNQAAFARCYRDSLNSGESSSRAMSAQLTIDTNVSGRIIAAKVEGAGLPSGLVRCLETAGRLGRVREADTGEVRATVSLRFHVR